MTKLILLYWGCVLLVYLSQSYYPVEPQLTGKHIGRHSFMWRKADIFMVIVIAWMTCFSFLRTSYNDTLTYIDSFRNAETLAEGFANGTFTDWTGNPWSMFYRSLMHDLTANYHIYFFFPAFLSSFAVVKLCKRYSVSPAFSLLIFFSIGTYVMYIAALKQCQKICAVLFAGCCCNLLSYPCVYVCHCTVASGKTLGESILGTAGRHGFRNGHL